MTNYLRTYPKQEIFQFHLKKLFVTALRDQPRPVLLGSSLSGNSHHVKSKPFSICRSKTVATNSLLVKTVQGE